VGANTDQSKWFIPCCYNPGCQECKGTGKIYPERCPVFYYRELKTLRYLYDNYTIRNILPYGGSPLEQPAVIMRTFDLIEYYTNFFMRIKEKDIETNKEVTANFKKRLKNG
jgi:hypothetical protein